MLIESTELKSRMDNLKGILKNKAAVEKGETKTILMGKAIGLELAEMLITEVEALTRTTRLRQLAGKVAPEPEGQCGDDGTCTECQDVSGIACSDAH